MRGIAPTPPHTKSSPRHTTSLCGMRVVVTGATGFLGGHLARTLASRHEVVGLGRNVTAGVALADAGIDFRSADISALSDADWSRLLDGADAVVHSAALSTLWGRVADYRRINVEPSEAVARVCAGAGTRLVHISSPSIYNATGMTAQVPESTVVGPRFDSRYARSKWLAEQAVSRAHPGALLLRPRGIYGPGDPGIIPRITRALRAGRLPRLVRGEVFTELTAVENVVHAIELALATDVSGPVNLTDGAATPIWATIDRVADRIGHPRPHRFVPAAVVERAAWLVERAALLDPRHREPTLTASGIRLLTRGMTLDLGRATDELRYRPVVAASDAIDRMIANLSPDGEA